MTLYFWDGQLLFRDGLLAKAEACCCTEGCPTPEEVPSFWITFTLPEICAGCCAAGDYTIEMPWSVLRNNWMFNDDDWCGTGTYLDIELSCALNLDGMPVFTLEFELGNSDGNCLWENPQRPYSLSCTASMSHTGWDCCGTGDFMFDIPLTITETAP